MARLRLAVLCRLAKVLQDQVSGICCSALSGDWRGEMESLAGWPFQQALREIIKECITTRVVVKSRPLVWCEDNEWSPGCSKEVVRLPLLLLFYFWGPWWLLHVSILWPKRLLWNNICLRNAYHEGPSRRADQAPAAPWESLQLPDVNLDKSLQRWAGHSSLS